MTSITFAIPDEIKDKMKSFSWINWSELVRRSILLYLIEKTNSSEEKELARWSVELGRKAKKGRFKRLLAELPPEKRKKIFGK